MHLLSQIQYMPETRILGECLLISSLPGKASRAHVESLGFLPGKLDIKRREPGILFISLQVVLLFKLAIMT